MSDDWEWWDEEEPPVVVHVPTVDYTPVCEPELLGVILGPDGEPVALVEAPARFIGFKSARCPS